MIQMKYPHMYWIMEAKLNEPISTTSRRIQLNDCILSITPRDSCVDVISHYTIYNTFQNDGARSRRSDGDSGVQELLHYTWYA